MCAWLRPLSRIVVLVLLIVCVAGCPERPPFNASGSYEGEWDTTGKALEGCGLTMQLFQLPKVPFIKFLVAGIVTFDLDCIIPIDTAGLLDIDLPELTVPLLGAMDEDGNLELALELDADKIPQELFEMFAGDVSTETPFEEFNVTFKGVGADADGDDSMDGYAGNFALWAKTAANTANLAGTFDVARKAE